MTTGALIFAYNNDCFDYVRMAAWSAANIRRHLGIPVALVTDQPTDLEFDRVIIHSSISEDRRWFSDIDQHVPWNNQARPESFDLSPWDRTLLLDADYVVASDQLRVLINDDRDQLLCHRWARDATGVNDFQGLNYFGAYQMPLYWATVMLFNRSKSSQHVFDCMKMIRANWTHYKNIYRDRSKTYRNDHALSIALNIVNGNQQNIAAIPWDLVTVLPECQLTQLDTDHYKVNFTKPDNRPAWVNIKGQDFHAMGKKALGDIIQ